MKILSNKQHNELIDSIKMLAKDNKDTKAVLNFQTTLNRKSKGGSGKSTRRDHISALEGVQGVAKFNEWARSDDGVARVLRAYFGHLKQAEWTVKPFDVNDPESVKRAEETADSLFNYSAKTFIENLQDILGYVRVGYSVFEPEYKLIATKYGLRYVLSDMGWRNQETLINWKSENGQVTEVYQTYYDPIEHKNVNELLEGKNLVIFTNDKEGTNIFGESFLRPIAGNVIRKQEFYENMMIGIEKSAMGIPIIKTPPGQANDSDAESIDTWADSYCVNEKSYLRVPQGYDVDVIKIDYDADKVMAAIEKENSMMLRASLLEFLDFGQDGNGSSFAIDQSRALDFIKRLTAYSKYIEDTISKDMIKTLEYSNHGISEGFSKLYAVGIRERITKDFALIIKDLTGVGMVKSDKTLREYFRTVLNLPEEEDIEEETTVIPPIPTDDKPNDTDDVDIDVDDDINIDNDDKNLAKEPNFKKRHKPKDINRDFDMLKDEYADLIEKDGNLIKVKMLADITKALNSKNPLGEVNKIKAGYVSSFKADLKGFITEGVLTGVKQSKKEMESAKVLAMADDITSKTRKWINATAETSADFISNDIKDVAILQTIKNVNSKQSTQKALFDASQAIDKIINNPNKNGQAVLVASSVSNGRDDGFKGNAPDDNPIVGWEYGTINGGVTDLCQWLDGRKVRDNDPNAELYRPPNHYNCNSYKIPIFKKDNVKVFEGWDVPSGLTDQKNLDGLYMILKKAVLL